MNLNIFKLNFERNYFGRNQSSKALSGDEMRLLFDDIVRLIKTYLPKALISWDIISSITENEMKILWKYFENSSNIDFINTSGGKTHAQSSSIGGDEAELTWSFMSSLTGRKIISDSGNLLIIFKCIKKKLIFKFNKDNGMKINLGLMKKMLTIEY